MQSEGWIVIGGDHIAWLHVSKRVVSLDGPIAFNRCSRIPALPTEPEDAAVEGYLVACYEWDDKAEQPGAGEVFWIESYASALKAARRIRQSILDERRPPLPLKEQLALFLTEADG